MCSPDFFDEVAPKLADQEYILIDRSKDIIRLAKPPLTHKVCKKCGKDREIKYFSKITVRYFASYCIDCVRRTAKIEYNNYKKERIEEINNWRDKNKEKVRGYNRKSWQMRQRIKKKIGLPDELHAASAS